MKPNLEEIPEFYQPYVNALPDEDIIDLLGRLGSEMVKVLEGLSSSESEFRYENGKWSIKELLLHIIDAERVFSYRALRFSRGDKTDLPGFDQDDYVKNCMISNRNLPELIDEFKNVRASSISLYASFDDSQLGLTGTGNGFEFSVNAICYITAGHQAHHLKILKERYLKLS